jgi:hypothetical protein
MVVVANFKGTQENPNLDFPDNGTWYDYINGGTISVSNNKATVTIPASSYRVYINKNFSPTTSVRELTPNRSSFPISVYPNPVTSVSVIKYELPRSGKVNLRLMSLQGQLIASKNLGYQLNGTQFFSLDDKDFKVKNLQSGTYLLQISVDNKISTERIIIQ